MAASLCAMAFHEPQHQRPRTYVSGLAPMLSHKPHRHSCHVHVHGISVQHYKIFRGPREHLCAVSDAKFYEERSKRPIVNVSWADPVAFQAATLPSRAQPCCIRFVRTGNSIVHGRTTTKCPGKGTRNFRLLIIFYVWRFL